MVLPRSVMSRAKSKVSGYVSKMSQQTLLSKQEVRRSYSHSAAAVRSLDDKMLVRCVYICMYDRTLACSSSTVMSSLVNLVF